MLNQFLLAPLINSQKWWWWGGTEKSPLWCLETCPPMAIKELAPNCGSISAAL